MQHRDSDEEEAQKQRLQRQNLQHVSHGEIANLNLSPLASIPQSRPFTQTQHPPNLQLPTESTPFQFQYSSETMTSVYSYPHHSQSSSYEQHLTVHPPSQSSSGSGSQPGYRRNSVPISQHRYAPYPHNLQLERSNWYPSAPSSSSQPSASRPSISAGHTPQPSYFSEALHRSFSAGSGSQTGGGAGGGAYQPPIPPPIEPATGSPSPTSNSTSLSPASVHIGSYLNTPVSAGFPTPTHTQAPHIPSLPLVSSTPTSFGNVGSQYSTTAGFNPILAGPSSTTLPVLPPPQAGYGQHLSSSYSGDDMQDLLAKEEKRKRNKESSQRFRDRTKERAREMKDKLDFLEQRVRELEEYERYVNSDPIKSLREEVTRLGGENAHLREKLMEYEAEVRRLRGNEPLPQTFERTQFGSHSPMDQDPRHSSHPSPTTLDNNGSNSKTPTPPKNSTSQTR
ncbi:hypothetical protein BT69DRAFT_1329932 [Atractiella rhizophila]|nr:hypothetical protein BT69DRAFT_1329932 [Atractiella rhizophila]